MRRLRLWAWIKRKLKPVKPLPLPPYVPYCQRCDDHGYRTRLAPPGLYVRRCIAPRCNVYLTDRAAGAAADRDLQLAHDLSIELLRWARGNPKLVKQDKRLELLLFTAERMQPHHLADDKNLPGVSVADLKGC